MNPWIYIAVGGLVGFMAYLVQANKTINYAVAISAFLFTIAVIITGYGFIKLSDKKPLLQVDCFLKEDKDPCTIICAVKNSGNAEARNVVLSFQKMLPVGTKLFAPAEIGAKIEESHYLPNPSVEPSSLSVLTAFSVVIPRIAPDDSGVQFKITTIDPENLQAGDEILKIHSQIVSMIKEFLSLLSERKIITLSDLNIKSAEMALYKMENIYTPGKLSYENGIFDIDFITKEERSEWKKIRNLWFSKKKIRKKLFKDRPKVKAPKIRIKTDHGNIYYAIFPPYVKSYSRGKISGKDLNEWLKMNFPEKVDTGLSHKR